MKRNKSSKESSYLYGTVTILLAIFWVYLIYLGVDMHQNQDADKIISKKTIIMTIPDNKNEPEEDTVTNEDLNQSIAVEEKSDPVIAILFDKIEYDSKFPDLLTSLPKEVTIGISPYDPFANEISLAAKENGNEIFIELPIINKEDKSDIKEYDLISTFNAEEIHYRLRNMLKKITNSVGVYNLGNEEFLNSANGIAAIVSHLHQENLFFLYGISGKTPILESDNESVFTVEACDNIVLKDSNPEQAKEELDAVVKTADKNGKAIVVFQYNENNIIALQNWINDLSNKKIRLVTIKRLPKKIKVSE